MPSTSQGIRVMPRSVYSLWRRLCSGRRAASSARPVQRCDPLVTHFGQSVPTFNSPPGDREASDSLFDQPNPHIKCQQISGGDGFATMGDGTQTYMFSFGPLSGLADIVKGLPGTQKSSEFNKTISTTSVILSMWSDRRAVSGNYAFNGAIGLVPDVEALDGARFAAGVTLFFGRASRRSPATSTRA